MDNVLVQSRFLAEFDPAPVEWCNRNSTSPVMLLCEHAGKEIPATLENLGLAPEVLDEHIGWDIGANELAKAISNRLSAPLILQRYSRLVIDCNRPPGSDESIPEVSDGTVVPSNASLTSFEKNLRRQAIFDPLDEAITHGFDIHPRRATFSVHSYTRTLNGKTRIWDAGFLSRSDTETANCLIGHIAQTAPQLTLGLNEPYQIDDAEDWFIPRHAEARSLRHTLIEVCNDQLMGPKGIAQWAHLLSNAISATLVDEI